MKPLELKLAGGVTLAVPPSLQAMTTYVLLEQESWFEKELGFVSRFLQPGMTAIDIGANLGTYSLLLAKLVGKTGRVFSYEPSSETRALLEQSRTLNGASQMEIIPFALSDTDRDGTLVFGTSSELHALGEGGAGEPVRITSLDREGARHGWSSPDFIKIDAEGEEERILAGGRDFFSRHSPLVMFEIMAGVKVNERLRALFPTLGYKLFRQLGRAPILVPDDPRQPLDLFELNMFAAKADRVSMLAGQGLLIEHEMLWEPAEADRANLLPYWRSLPFAEGFGIVRERGVPSDAAYCDGLTAYMVWCDSSQPLAQRCGALNAAVRHLRIASAQVPTVERLSTFARAAADAGLRVESVQALQRLMTIVDQQRGNLPIREPLWPASLRFDRLAPGDQPGAWFIAAAAEQWQRTLSWSTWFTGATPALDWLCAQTFSEADMERRRTLAAAKAGKRPSVPPRLCIDAPDHLNADVWRSGLVPGTAIGR